MISKFRKRLFEENLSVLVINIETMQFVYVCVYDVSNNINFIILYICNMYSMLYTLLIYTYVTSHKYRSDLCVGF